MAGHRLLGARPNRGVRPAGPPAVALRPDGPGPAGQALPGPGPAQRRRPVQRRLQPPGDRGRPAHRLGGLAVRAHRPGRLGPRLPRQARRGGPGPALLLPRGARPDHGAALDRARDKGPASPRPGGRAAGRLGPGRGTRSTAPARRGRLGDALAFLVAGPPREGRSGLLQGQDGRAGRPPPPASREAQAMPTETFVIVGASLAGAKAAETLRDEGFEGRVVLVGEESFRPYERPPLSKGYLRGEQGFEDAAVHPAGWRSPAPTWPGSTTCAAWPTPTPCARLSPPPHAWSWWGRAGSGRRWRPPPA